MDDSQGRQAGPGSNAPGQFGKVRQRCEHQHAGAHLDQGDKMRRRALQALHDQRGKGIQQRGSERQEDTEQVVPARGVAVAVGADDRQHAGERKPQPAQLARRDLLAEKRRA